jgi:hypothetical protein
VPFSGALGEDDDAVGIDVVLRVTSLREGLGLVAWANEMSARTTDGEEGGSVAYHFYSAIQMRSLERRCRAEAP